MTQTVTQNHYNTPECKNIYAKREFSSKCMTEVKTKMVCAKDHVEVHANCDDDCENCRDILQNPTAVCNSTRELESYSFSCTDHSKIDVNEFGYISETYFNNKCEGEPFEKEQMVGNICSKKEKHLCEGGLVKVFHYRTEDCSGDSYKSENRYTLNTCVELSPGLYRKVLHCGNDPLLPQWFIIASVVSGSVLLGLIFLLVASIFIFFTAIRKGSYYNPKIEEEKGIVEGYSEL
eukprot:gene7644-11966_t